MTFGSQEFVVIGYWGTWILLYGLNWVLLRGLRRHEAWEIREAYPQYKRALTLLPWAEIVPTLGLVVVLLLVWTAGFLSGELPGHVLGLFYGLMLMGRAIFSRVTGICSTTVLGRTAYILEAGRTWRGTLQLSLAGVYLAVPAIFLLSMSA